MSIPMNSHCVDCVFKKYMETARQAGDDETAYLFAKKIMALFLESGKMESSSTLGARINRLCTELYGLPQDRFRQEKEESNRFVMARLEKIRQKVRQAEEPLLTAMQYAILGNYIDFSALGKSVSFAALDEMLQNPQKFAFETQDFERFCGDMKKAKNLLIFTDNAGEIGFDWILAEVLQQQYPDADITFCVRGTPVYNDATREDYALMGIPFPVIDNGSDIGGTDLDYIGDEARRAMENADVILAKGMGNTETLYGCGYNVYYAFLVKCKRFQQVFNKPHMTAMFVRDNG